MAKLSLFLLSFFLGLVVSLPWIPEPRADEDWWLERHEGYVQNSNINGQNISIIFFGDSIVEAWGADGAATFDQYYAPLGAANYGIGNDRTEHVLWRIVNGELNGLNSAKVCVVKIGTNNFWLNDDDWNKDEEIARGIAAITDAIRSRQPRMKVLLLGILPRNDAEFTERVEVINQRVSILDNGNTVRFFNMRDSFYNGNGSLVTELYSNDLLHLSSEGYAKWAEVMDPIFREMLRQ